MKLLKPHWLFFIALAVSYLAFSPGTISDMGYMAENLEACHEIISNLGEWVTFQYASTRVSWPRHGLYELILEIPFILVGKLFLGAAPEESALAVSLQPVIFSALLCTLLFAWVRRITGSLAWAFALGLATAFSTMIWPYAYIGLETTQSLFLLLTGFIAIELKEKRSWKVAVLLSVCAAMSISLKSNGVFLGPAVAYLGYSYFKPELESGLRGSRRSLLKPSASALLVLSLYLVNSYIRSLSPIWHPGTYKMLLHSVADSWETVLFNMFSLFGSTNKGLIIYSPILLLCLIALRRAYRSRPDISIFAALTLFGLGAGCSLLYFWGDETWGPRYLHSSVAPLVLVLAASRVGVPFRMRTEAALAALAVLGAFISFLGVAFHYGNLHKAAVETGQSTIENLQTQPAWNPIRFNLKLLLTRAGAGKEQAIEPVNWPPEPHWWYGKPLEAPELKTVDLRKFTNPQPLILRDGADFQGPGERAVRIIYSNLLWIGALLLIITGYTCLKRERARERAMAARVRGVKNADAAG
ncbi:MAG TPA: hypothetical protein VNH22_14785 [Blastocatellia bacterium]|jgi:hypothetical protein|nr:hypothetical protein [Blastocatellia bacterium]